jgi:hypothetical protein
VGGFAFKAGIDILSIALVAVLISAFLAHAIDSDESLFAVIGTFLSVVE